MGMGMCVEIEDGWVRVLGVYVYLFWGACSDTRVHLGLSTVAYSSREWRVCVCVCVCSNAG